MNAVRPEVDQFVASLSQDIQAVTGAVRDLVTALLPGTLEMLDTPTRLFGYGRDRTYRGLICTVAPHDRHVSLIFSKGAMLADPLGLLEGTGQSARHVTFRSPQDVERPGVGELIRQAGLLTP